MTRIVSMLALLGLVACGGASAEQRPLAAGATHPTKDQCVAAVNNYEHTEFIQNPYPLQVREAVRDNSYQLRREQRLRQCSTDLTATEADCMSKAQTLVMADACAPSERW